MPTANEQFLDAMVRHQIGLMRFSGSVRNEIFGLLDATEADIVREIRARIKPGGITPANVQRLKALEVVIRGIRGGAWKDVSKVWGTEFRNLAVQNPQFVANAIQTVLPVTVALNMPAPELLRALVVTKPFEGKTMREWSRSIAQSDLNRIMDQVKIGMVQGESNQAIARRVVGTKALGGRNGTTEVSRRGAESITRTATNHFSNQANRAFFEDNAKLFSGEIYHATLDDRTTLICSSLDGERFPVGEGPIPPLHFRCRSLRVAIINDEVVGTRFAKPFTEKQRLREFTKERGLKSVKNRKELPRGTKGDFDKFQRAANRRDIGKVPAKVTYQEWLTRQSPAFQTDVLGGARAKLFRQGKLPLKKFVNRAGDDIPLRDLAKFQRQAFIDAGLDPDSF